MNRFLRMVLPLLLAGAQVAAASIHIVAYGDSGVAGKGVPSDQAYPAQLEAMLKKKGFDVSVANRGVNGRTSSDAVADLDAAVPAGTDIAIVQFGVNDIKRGGNAEDVRKNMSEVLRRLQARGIGVLVVGYPAADLAGVAASHGALYVSWGGLPDPKYHVPNDPNHHFNAAGLQVMAARLLPAVEKLIGQRGKR